MNVRLSPIPQSFLDRVRIDGVDDLGQPVRRVRAKGGEPCRDVLRRASEGEELILASFTPFTRATPYREYGPIFVLGNPSAEDIRRNAVPVNGYLREHFVIRAYSDGEEILDAALVGSGDAQPTIERFFGKPETSFLHVRFPTYGCFACRIDRA